MKKENWILFILAAVNFTHIVDFMIMMPLGPQLMRLFSITPQQHSALVSSYTISAGVASFFMAFSLDLFDRKKALQIAYALFCVGTFACALAPNYYMLLFARAFAGCFGGIQSAIVLAIIGDIIPLERRGTAMGVVMTAFSVASVLGVPFSLFLAEKISWHFPFVFIGTTGVIVFFLLTWILPPIRKHLEGELIRINPLKTIQSIVSDSNQLRALLFTSVLTLGHFMIVPFLSPYMVSNVGFREADLPWIYFLGGGLTIFSAPWFGRISDRYGKQKVFTIFSAIVPIPVLLLTHMSQSPLWIGLLVTCLFFVCSNGRFVPSTTMITAVVPPAQRGTFMSINTSVQQLASGVAAAIAGFIVTADSAGRLVSYNHVGVLSALLAIGTLFLGYRVQLKN